MSKEISYNFYATLLDAYQNYLDSDKLWEKFWGSSDNPKMTITEYGEQSKKDLIDKINRVPFDSEAALKGTCFNEVVDCIIEHRNTDKMEVSRVYEEGKLKALSVKYNNREFVYPIELCTDLAWYFKGAVTQYYCEAILPTKYGNVKLYGYLDELMPTCIHDIKTTSRYEAYKFRDHWQHIVYPYCLRQEGNDVSKFEYDIVKWGKDMSYEFFTEVYNYNESVDLPRLIAHCEGLIEFLQANKDCITDKKIFNRHESDN